MKRVMALVMVTVVVAAGCGYGGETEEAEPMVDEATETEETAGSILRNDPAMDDLVPVDAVVEKVADGFDIHRGPGVGAGRPRAAVLQRHPGATRSTAGPRARATVVFLQPVLPDDAPTPAEPADRTGWRSTLTAGSSCASTAGAGCPRWRSTASG